MKLALESEEYSRQGNISADGIGKLLGAPDLNRIEAVIREAAQNSWDARMEGATPEFRLHLRTLTSAQRSLMSELFSDSSVRKEDRESLRSFLEDPRPRVLEISDFSTAGLGGPVYADAVPEAGESTNFVDFLRNIGSPRDVHHGGGTYGYGKSSLYAASLCRTILIDTVIKNQGVLERRIIASMVGGRFDALNPGRKSRRYTGRHWWGSSAGNDSGVIPVTGSEAEEIGGCLQNRAEHPGVTGTTILVLNPDITPEEFPGEAAVMLRVLLKFFWPKMVATESGTLPMRFSVLVEGVDHEVPHPAEVPGLSIFVDCLKRIRSQERGTTPIDHRRPRRRLGLCDFKKEMRLRGAGATGLWPRPDESLHHVALMRPAELVVKYLKGEMVQGGRVDWAGVFVCDSDDEVESAFAASEPPAHDDWNPASLPSGVQKSIVTVALRNLREEMKRFTGAPTPSVTDPAGGGVPLGIFGDAIGKSLGLGTGGRLGGGPGNRPRPRPGPPRPGVRGNFGTPVFLGHEKFGSENDLVAVFETEIFASDSDTTFIAAIPEVVWDNGGKDSASAGRIAPNGTEVRVLGWRDSGGRMISESDVLEITKEGRQRWQVLVSLPDDVAVSVNIKPRDPADLIGKPGAK